MIWLLLYTHCLTAVAVLQLTEYYLFDEPPPNKWDARCALIFAPITVGILLGACISKKLVTEIEERTSE